MPPLIPKLAVPLRIQPNGQAPPELFDGTWTGAANTYRTAAGATLAPDVTIFHGDSPGTEVSTPGAKAQEGADSGNGAFAVEAGVEYPCMAWVKGKAGGELLDLFVGDGTIGTAIKGFTATGNWQLVEVIYTPTLSGETGIAVVTQGTHAYTYWVEDAHVRGPAPSSFATVPQGSVDEIAQCVYAILGTPRGSRLDEPDFGVEEVTFDQAPLDLDDWRTAIREWEPRASVDTDQEIEDLLTKVGVKVSL
jgi:hypothetical protein